MSNTKSELLTSVTVEIPKGSNIKYEFNHISGDVRVDRIIAAPFKYPQNYGFIPETLDYDGDPLDVLIVGDFSLAPLTIINVRPIGVLLFDDEGLTDNKLICIFPKGQQFGDIQEVAELPTEILDEIEHFFCHYKDAEKKVVAVHGYDNAARAYKLICESENLYVRFENEFHSLPKEELVKLLKAKKIR